MLVYRRRNDARFSDVLRALDLAPDPVAMARALAAAMAGSPPVAGEDSVTRFFDWVRP